MNPHIKTIFNNCLSNEPASKDFYLDCSAARGGGTLVDELLRRLDLAEQPRAMLFAGHVGCGKSSELAELKRQLSGPRPSGTRFLPILVDADDYFDFYDVDITDLILALVAELATKVREAAGIELQDSYFSRRFDELLRFLRSEVEVEEATLPLSQVSVKVRRLKKDPTVREKVRDALRMQTTTLLEEFNSVIDKARSELNKQWCGKDGVSRADLVLIVDNLEKVRVFGGREEGLVSQHELFIGHYPQLTGLAASVIYTVPLRLVRSVDAPQLEQRYSPPFLVLPMVKTIERGSRRPYEPGRQRLREMLQRRVEPLPLDQVFAPDALDFLLTYCGGQMRSLLMFVQNACTYADDLPLTLPLVQRAVQQTVRLYSTSIPESHWEKLARLDVSADQSVPGGDEDVLAMLENLSVLEYLNGGGPGAFIEPWYAVNPIVRELAKFKVARAALTQVSP